MKRHDSITLLMMLLFSLALSGCQKDISPEAEGPKDPEFSFTEEILHVSAEGGKVEAAYTLENPIEGASLEISCDKTWVSEINCSEKGKISLDIAPNSENEEREARLTVHYDGIDPAPTLKIIQAAGTTPDLSISISLIEASSVIYSVVRADPGMAYVLRLKAKSEMSEKELESDQALWESELRFFRSEAGFYGENLENTIMGFYALEEDLDEFEHQGLSPETDYVLYAYGINVMENEALLLTDIYRTEFQTLAFEKIQVDFRLESDVDRASVKVSIDPGDYDGPYYFNIFEGILNSEEASLLAHEYWMINRENMLAYGYSPQEIIYYLCLNGKQVQEHELNADTDYTAVVFAIHPETAVYYSDASVSSFRTESIGSSDNLIGISIHNIKERSFDVTTDPLNDDPYFSATIRTQDIEGMTDEEIIDYMLTMYTHKTFCGGYTETVSGLYPETSYTVILFGLEGGVVTTGIFRQEAVTLKSTASQGKIWLEFGEYYDIAEAAALNHELDPYLEYGEALLIVNAVTDPDDIPAHLCYFTIFSLDEHEKLGIELTDNYIINTLMMEGAQNYKDKALNLYYGERLMGAAIIVDEMGNISELWKSEVFIKDKDGVSDPQGLLDWMTGK